MKLHILKEAYADLIECDKETDTGMVLSLLPDPIKRQYGYALNLGWYYTNKVSGYIINVGQLEVVIALAGEMHDVEKDYSICQIGVEQKFFALCEFDSNLANEVAFTIPNFEKKLFWLAKLNKS